MGTVDGITYGDPKWRIDSAAAMDEAERRIALVLSDPARTTLFLSDLFALRELPESLARCTYLRELRVGDAEGPDGVVYDDRRRRVLAGWGRIASLAGLQSLDISGSTISDLAPLDGLKELRNLNCSQTQISDLAPLADLNELQSLDCSGTQISDLAPLAGLNELQSLYCSWTQISDLAPLDGLKELRNLYCRATSISDLAPLAGLNELQSLDCWWTEISDLAPLADLNELQTLDCSGTQINDLAPLAGLKGLHSLNCWGTQIGDLASLAGLNELQTLDCSEAQISDLAPLADLKGLHSLDCSEAQISDLAPLAGLKGLQSLNCSGTQISDLAPLAGLKGLQSLDCSRTQISDLAPLAGLKGLQSLNCSGTQISDLAPLAGLNELHSLNCSRAQISDVSCLSSCLMLRSLSVSECHLDILPTALIWSDSLLKVRASGARFPGIPDEILSQTASDSCLQDLRAHLTDLGDDPDTLGDVKLSVLGNGRIGKTQICNRLRDLPFEPDADSTHGVVLSTAPIPGSEFAFNLWDFGGQDIYHGTHALFLKSRAIFLVVWTPETDNYDTVKDLASGMISRNQKLDWWLDYVRRYASPQSPLIVVQNQIDVTPDNGEHPAVVALRQEGRQGLCRSMGYSAKNKTGHPTLLDNLTQAVARFNPPLIGKGRKAVIAHLRALRAADERRPAAEREHRLMSLADFEAECSRAGGISNPRLFLNFLNNAGEVFWREGCFDNNIILDQAWVLEAVYTVFNREKCVAILTQQEGRFSSDLLDALVWGSAGYSQDDQRLFLEFMVSAGICFEVGSYRTSKYVAPDYLPAEDRARDMFPFDRGNARCLRFDSLPPLLMRNLISRVGREARDHAHYWRNGAVYFDDKWRSRVLIEQSCSRDWKGEICIVAEGGDTRKAMDAAVAAVLEEARRLGAPSKEDCRIDEDSRMSAGPDPAKPTTYYVSYAWNDKTDPSENLEEVVDGLCAEATKRGIHVHRDKDDIKLNGRISEFMARLARGDRIVVILSDRYLKSRACMTELYEIWLQARAEDAVFLEKVRIFTHSGTKIFTPVDRARLAKYWADLYDDEKFVLEYMGASDRVNHLALKKFAAHVGDILTVVADTLHPRTLDQLLDYCFD
ncbi:hypothetical protein ANOBCDAF_04707 [Pleomorphomonas sp. T1.2MG-36]|uniref:leucine-rich repeat domain-containing protein n=1 Tax=Pleomorphomonas sp. T1.2MG-36 TaxID=3041167 RepID=UPI002477AC0D|nr:leucine-rich repeat domain-containing protein [Pleomorphomonas sp. T1.2MG-36]CAI9404881.1 hypothetical protein ANOBCDAF_04707 [Pleomorphomonas sp. T1.2MG-36]